jgi:hypothetical protein
MRAATIGRRAGQLVLLASLAGAPALQAQESCDALVARASNEFDTGRRLQLLTAAVDPATCPPRGAWTVAIQLLAQTLIEDRQDSLAAVWLRWGARLAPDMQPDTVQFLPSVVQAFRAARTYVNRTSVTGDTAALTTWRWPTPVTTTARDGKLQLTSPTAEVRFDVPGFGAVPQGGSLSLAPKSYVVIAASADDSARVTREVLPGVTTVIDFRLREKAVAAAAPPPPPPQVAPEKKKGLPTWVWVAGAAAAAWAVAWNAYIKSH